jgi:hypothetical protein
MQNGKRVAVIFFNGHTDLHSLTEPLGRTEFNNFFQAQSQPPQPLSKIAKAI